MKVGFSKFAMLCPSEYVLAGSSRTHSVCMCTIHQNIKLTMIGAKMAKIAGLEKYHHMNACMLCNPAQLVCYFRPCPNCPSVDEFENELVELYELEGIGEIQFQQWTSTDCSELSHVQILQTKEFLEIFVQKATILAQHDFIAKSQSAFLKSKRNDINEEEFVVIDDFSENYSFIVQDSVQGYHWNNCQSIIHLWVYYFKSDGELKHRSYMVISDCNTHNFVAICLFQKMPIEHLKSVFPSIKKTFYFSKIASHF